jgi:hypothetical protein
MNFVRWHRTEVSGQLYSQEGIAIAQWIGGWVGMRADLVLIMVQEVLLPAGNCTLFMWSIAELLYAITDIFHEDTPAFCAHLDRNSGNTH